MPLRTYFQVIWKIRRSGVGFVPCFTQLGQVRLDSHNLLCYTGTVSRIAQSLQATQPRFNTHRTKATHESTAVVNDAWNFVTILPHTVTIQCTAWWHIPAGLLGMWHKYVHVENKQKLKRRFFCVSSFTERHTEGWEACRQCLVFLSHAGSV
jgi:hypothetical protein